MDEIQMGNKKRLLMYKKINGSNEKKDDKKNRCRVIAVASGKGGVGKSNISLNLAIKLQQKGNKILLIDADMGMANIDVLIGKKTEYNLGDVINGSKNIKDVLIQGPSGLQILPGSAGTDNFLDITTAAIERLLNLSARLENNYDLILIDVGAGAHSDRSKSLLANLVGLPRGKSRRF